MGRWRVLLVFFFSFAVHAATGDEDFLAAHEAFRAGNSAGMEARAARLKGHPLESYLAYWQLSLRLEQLAAEEVRRFLTAHGDSLLAERLRSEWLKALGRRGQWSLFDAELPLLADRDVEITCYELQSRLRSGAGEALIEARPLWFVARDLPDSCTPLFDALVATGMLSNEDLWTRIRLMLESGQVGLARRVAGLLPAGQGPESGIWESIAADAAAYLERTRASSLKSRAGRESFFFAVHRLARTTLDQAVQYLTKFEERLSAEERAYAWGVIAFLGATRHDPGALGWFARAGGLSDSQLAWKARAALRVQDWKQVRTAIEAMTDKSASESVWRYWKARALKAQGSTEEAGLLFRPLATEFNFYGQLALEELGGAIAAPAATFKPGAEEIRSMGRNPGLRRALELYRLGLRTEANREWLWAIRGFDDRQLLVAAEVARRHEVYDRAISTADRTVAMHDFGLRYPAPYRELLKAHTTQLALDEAWVYGVIRQESRFVTSARSSAGASGLMQLMPGTAKWVASRLGLKNWRWSQVNEVNTNVSLGTYYLRHVLDVLDGQPVLASAAYNAGPSRARAWRPESAMEGAVYAETIPIRETRDYVKRVMANAGYYAYNFTQQVQSLKDRLGVVGPWSHTGETLASDTP